VPIVYRERRVRKEIMVWMVGLAPRETAVHLEIVDRKDHLEMMEDLEYLALLDHRFVPEPLSHFSLYV